MNKKSDPPKEVVDPKRAKRFVDLIEEGDNLIPPSKQKHKDKSTKGAEEP